MVKSKSVTTKSITFVEFAKQYHNLELRPEQVEMVEHIMAGDRMVIMHPVRYGMSHFNRVAKEYLDRFYRVTDMATKDPDGTQGQSKPSSKVKIN